MLEIIGKCFSRRLPEWKEKLQEMVPSYGQSLKRDPNLYRKVRAEADGTLGLQGHPAVARM